MATTADGVGAQGLTIVGKLQARTFVAMIRSFFEAGRMLRQWRPDLVIGTGGYVCGPIMSVAALRGIPTLLHESNALPGVTTRLLAPYMSRVAVNFEDAIPRLSRRARVHVTGNPIRPALLTAQRDPSRAQLGLEKGKPFVVVFFGSLGSATLNRVMIRMLKDHPEGFGFRLVFAVECRLSRCAPMPCRARRSRSRCAWTRSSRASSSMRASIRG